MSGTTRPNVVLRLLASKQLFWVTAIALLFVLTFWWVPGDSTSNNDSYSTEVTGKHAYFQGIRTLHGNVSRSVKELVPPRAGTIVILSPARIPGEEEWLELSRFVSNGGRLLYVAGAYTKGFTSGPFGVTLTNSWTPPEVPLPSQPEETTFGIAKIWNNRNLPWASTSSLTVQGQGAWNEVLVTNRSGIQAVRCRHGRGYAVFVASDVVFQNRSMFDATSQAVASQLFELTKPRSLIFFDESLSSSGTPRVLGILFTPLFRPLSLQLLLVAVLFGWWGSRRFGPAIQAKSSDRRAIVEHAQALGNMHYKVGTASHALKSYFDYFRSVSQMPGGRIDKVADVLAARSGIERTEVERLLTETQKAIQAPNIGPGTAATLIQQLANLRDRMMQFGERTGN